MKQQSNIKILQKQLDAEEKQFLKELKQFRKNRSKFGVVEKLPGGYSFRFKNKHFGENPKMSPVGY